MILAWVVVLHALLALVSVGWLRERKLRLAREQKLEAEQETISDLMIERRNLLDEVDSLRSRLYN